MTGLREQLQSIYDQHGKLTPELLVEVARPETHPLHSRVFDRAPSEAAEAWYRHRAHELIRSVKVVYRDADETSAEKSVRAFHAVRSPGPDPYVYEPVDEVMADDFKRTLVLRDMEREWKTLYRRYNQFVEFAEMVSGDLGQATG